MKQCNKCFAIKQLTEFPRNCRAKDGHLLSCKICQNAHVRTLRIQRELVNPLIKQKRLANSRAYAATETALTKSRETNRKLYPLIKTAKSRKNKERYANDPVYRAAKLASNTANKRKRLKTDLDFKIRCTLRGRLNSAVKNGQKAGSAVKDLGCTISQLIIWLEQQFSPGMTWKNHSRHGWHIDHIKPLSSFDLTVRDQFLQACHYSNLQPLWSTDNLSKSSKIQ